MVKRGLLVRHGRGRAVWYSLPQTVQVYAHNQVFVPVLYHLYRESEVTDRTKDAFWGIGRSVGDV